MIMMIEKKEKPLIVLVGRTNVGKSSLFNRLTGKRYALTADEHGVTRDVQIKPAQLADLHFMCADTAGLQSRDGDKEQKMRDFVVQYAQNADAIIIMVDGLCHLSSEDDEIVRLMRRIQKPKILCVNKCENNRKIQDYLPEFSRLGIQPMVEISAAHGDGMGELYDALRDIVPQLAEGEGEETEKPINFTIMGRPNVGKSSLVNRLLGYERVLAGAEAGLTRDATHHRFTYNEQMFEVIDTAGMRKKTAVNVGLEKDSVGLSLQALKYTHTGVLMVDASLGIEKQDLNIANAIISEGRNLVIALNKWDLIADKAGFMEHTRNLLSYSLAQMKKLPVIPISAQNGFGVNDLMDIIIKSNDAWNQRIPTYLLNQWLREIVQKHPHNSIKGNKPKFRYMTQIKTRPPHFVFFVSRKHLIEDSYLSYLENRLRESFEFMGAPIRFTLRVGKNPYNDEKENA